MKTLRHARRFLVYLCLAVIVFAALTHAGTALPVILFAVFWVFAAVTIGPLVGTKTEGLAIQPAPILPVGSPRPPPIQ